MRRASGKRIWAAGLVAGLVALPGIAAGAHHKFRVELAGVNSAGARANNNASTEGSEQLSHDGRFFAFTAQSTNLPHGDGTDYMPYVHDFKTGKTKLVSVNSKGKPADGQFNYAEISANGRIVTFDGSATNRLSGAGTNGQVWAHDLKTGKTELVSQTSAGAPGAGGASSLATASADGRFVSFESRAINLPHGDGSTRFAYVRDLKKGKTVLASRNSAGNPVEGHSYGQSLSGNGRTLVFASDDPKLPNGGDPDDHIYVRNLKTGTTRQVDVLPNGTSANEVSRSPSISQNGRYVAFDSRATNFPGGLSSDGLGCYVFDRLTGKVRLVSRLSNGTPANGSEPRISADGSIVTFESLDPNLTQDMTGTLYETFARNLGTGKTIMLSRTKKGHPGNADTYYTSVSANGRFASFEGYASNLGADPSHNITAAFRAGPIP